MTECKYCFGTGSLDAGVNEKGVPITKPCRCQLARDLVANINRAWSGLSSAERVEESPLSKHVAANLYITADQVTLRAHLRHIGLRASPYWGFKVVSDSDLMTAWLAPVGLLGKEILDPDAASVSTEKATLVDLTEPPELLIIYLGVKSARNSAMPEVLLEAITHRLHIRKPTWVVDQPSRRFDPAHISYCEDSLNIMQRWERVVLNAIPTGLSITMIGGTERPTTQSPANPMSLSAGYSSQGAGTGATTRIERPTKAPKRPKWKDPSK